MKGGMWVRSTLTHGVQACLIGRGSRVEVQHFVGICCSGIWNTARSRSWIKGQLKSRESDWPEDGFLISKSMGLDSQVK